MLRAKTSIQVLTCSQACYQARVRKYTLDFLSFAPQTIASTSGFL